jgi:hypothetical protein
MVAIHILLHIKCYYWIYSDCSSVRGGTIQFDLRNSSDLFGSDMIENLK